MTAPLAEYTATVEREPRFRCRHPKSAANTVYRRKHVGEPFRPACRRCEERRNATLKAQYQATKRVRKPWIVPTGDDYQRLMAEARSEFNRLCGVADSTDPAQRALALGEP